MVPRDTAAARAPGDPHFARWLSLFAALAIGPGCAVADDAAPGLVFAGGAGAGAADGQGLDAQATTADDAGARQGRRGAADARLAPADAFASAADAAAETGSAADAGAAGAGASAACVASTDCAKGTYCATGTCVAHACAPGSVACKGTASRRVCHADGSGFDVAACPAGKACEDGLCQTLVCTPGGVSCLGNAVATCSPAGVALSFTACGPGETCQGGQCKAPSCKPGQKVCTSPKTASVCSEDGLSAVSQACGDGTVCMAGVCVGQSCTPGATSCSGAKVQKCSLTGLEWSPEQDCAKLGFTCKAGACVPALCGDGVVQPPETCDDGNSKEGDGCGAGCQSETVWQELLVEDFEDAKAQDWTTYKGGCGWQGAKAVDGAMVWSMNSDWAGMRRELPKVGASYGAYEAEVRLVNTQGKAWIGFRAKSLSWNENDKGGYNFQLSPDGHVLFCTGNGCSNQVKLPLAIGLWTTLRVEEDLKAQTWQARMDGKLMASGSLGAISGSGGLFALHVNGKCDSERLQVQQVRVLGAK